MKRAFFVVFIAASLYGCATPYTGQTVMEEGPLPSQDQARTAILNYLKRNLKDPDSLRDFNLYTSPVVVTWYRGLVNGGGNEKAWLYCFEYNAKNSYGGYVGIKKDGLAMRTYTGAQEPYIITNVNWGLASTHCW